MLLLKAANFGLGPSDAVDRPTFQSSLDSSISSSRVVWKGVAPKRPSVLMNSARERPAISAALAWEIISSSYHLTDAAIRSSATNDAGSLRNADSAGVVCSVPLFKAADFRLYPSNAAVDEIEDGMFESTHRYCLQGHGCEYLKESPGRHLLPAVIRHLQKCAQGRALQQGEDGCAYFCRRPRQAIQHDRRLGAGAHHRLIADEDQFERLASIGIVVEDDVVGQFDARMRRATGIRKRHGEDVTFCVVVDCFHSITIFQSSRP